MNLSASQATFECRSDTNTIKTGSRDGIDRIIGHAASSGNVFDNPDLFDAKSKASMKMVIVSR